MTIRNYHLVNLIAACLSFFGAAAQKDTIASSENQPFDKAYVLKLPTGNKDIAHSASLFEIDNKGCLRTIKGCFKIGDLFKKRGAESLDFPVVRQDSTGTVFVSMPPLEPNNEYLLLLNYSLPVKSLDSVFERIENNNRTEAMTIYNHLRERTAKVFQTRFKNECQCKISPSFKSHPYNDIEYFYFTELQDHYRRLNMLITQKNTLSTMIPYCNFTPLTLSNAFLKDIIKKSQNCMDCPKKLWEYQWLDSTSKNPPDLLLKYLQFDQDASRGITPNIDTKLDKKITNLIELKSQIDEAIKNIDYFHTKYGITDYATNMQNLITFRDCINTNLTALTTYKNQLSAIEKDIAALVNEKNEIIRNHEGFFVAVSSTISNTFTYGFETRSSLYIRPDFGFMTYGSSGNNESFWGVSPYLGFHVNFRPLNTEIPYRTIRHKGLMGHLSFNAGVVIASLKEEGKRDGIIGNTSIFTGFGYAFGHAARIVFGPVWYQKKDPNPLVNKKTVAAVPFIGLSIDLRLRDIYETFTKLF